MANHTKHLSNYRSAQQRVNAAANFKVPGGAQKLDARLPTEQLAAVLAGLKVIDMRLAKARKELKLATAYGNASILPPQLAAKVATLTALQARQQGHAQRLADAIQIQWERDQRWHDSNADKGTLLAQPRYRNETEANAALALAGRKKVYSPR